LALPFLKPARTALRAKAVDINLPLDQNIKKRNIIPKIGIMKMANRRTGGTT
jgi:hypothetical protein